MRRKYWTGIAAHSDAKGLSCDAEIESEARLSSFITDNHDIWILPRDKTIPSWLNHDDIVLSLGRC